MRILHGMSEVAGQGIYSVLGLKKNGYQANMAVWSRNPSNYPIDIDLGINKSKKYMFPLYAVRMGLFALKGFRSYDVVHSHYGYSLIPFNLDVPFFRILKKKLFAEFHGSDLRAAFHDVEYPHFIVPTPSEKNRKKLQRRLGRLLSYADGVILHDVELLPHLPNIDKPVYIVPLRVDLSKFSPVYPEVKKERPVIVHAPSKRSGKGTAGILRALEAVKQDYELILVEGKTQEEAIELYKRADIIIDQVSVGSYGVFAIEAMALGKPVITYISEELKESFPDELPIISADFDTMTETIEDLIRDGEKRHKLGQAGRAYAERYHDNVRVAAYLAKVYDGTITDHNLFNVL